MRIVENIVRQALMDILNHPMKLKESVKVSEELKYHLDKKITLSENVFRTYSKSFINLINEVRSLYKRGLIELNEEDKRIVESDLAKKVLLEDGRVIYLEIPIEDKRFISEAEYQGRKVQLGKIMQGDVKKFKVYVKNDKGNVVKVNFGFGGKSAKGKRMTIKKNNPQRRKSFRARHNCDNPGPRWKARYWACRTW
jgi:D-Tyr-tRNAtyr deacylase